MEQDSTDLKSWKVPAPRSGELLLRVAFGLSVILLIAAVWTSSRYLIRPADIKPVPLLAEEDPGVANVRKFTFQGVATIRDFLLNNHLNAVEIYDQDTRKQRANTMKAMEVLRTGDYDKAQVQQIDRDIKELWRVLDYTRGFSAKKKSEEGFDYLRGDVISARNALGQSLKDLSTQMIERRKAAEAANARERSWHLEWVFVSLAVCVLLSILLVVVSLLYRRNLQRESLVKYEEIAQARDDLEQLSARLLKVQEEERRRLSRELHDGIGQTLTALRMEIHQTLLNPGMVSGIEERLGRARMLAEEAVHTVKDISLLLRPPLLDDLGLEPAIAWQTDQFTRRTGIPCRFRAVDLREMLPDDIKTCVFRVIQEALNNCQKHASPTQVQILIEQLPEMLCVQVEDDGAGFALSAKNTPARHTGLGILGMRERATMLGGSFTIQSAPGMGTQLKLLLPLAKMTAPPQRMVRAVSLPAIAAAEE